MDVFSVFLFLPAGLTGNPIPSGNRMATLKNPNMSLVITQVGGIYSCQKRRATQCAFEKGYKQSTTFVLSPYCR